MAKKPVSPERLEQLRQMRERRLAKLAAEKAQRRAAADEPTHAPTLAELLPEQAAAVEPDEFVDDILSAEEREAIRKEAVAKVAAERKARAKKALLEEAMDAERHAVGDVSDEELLDEEMKEIVSIRVNLPSLRTPVGTDVPPDPIIIDGHVYHHNTYHKVPKHQAIYMESLMSLAFRHAAHVDGRSRNYYNAQLGQVIYQGGTAAGGSSQQLGFDAIHRRR